MSYDLNETATLYEATVNAETGLVESRWQAQGSLHSMVARCMSWESDRFARARILTESYASYGPSLIEEIGNGEAIPPASAA